jgi:hypothetical protein
VKFLVGLIIVVGLSLGVWQIYQLWENDKEKSPDTTASPPAAPPEISGEELRGLPPNLQGPLRTAEEHGAAALRAFLTAHGGEIKDPRRAWIELDYVVLVGASDPGEARLVFRKVQARLTPASPVYNRMKLLEKTYE